MIFCDVGDFVDLGSELKQLIYMQQVYRRRKKLSKSSPISLKVLLLQRYVLCYLVSDRSQLIVVMSSFWMFGIRL